MKIKNINKNFNRLNVKFIIIIKSKTDTLKNTQKLNKIF